jgi:hypothetical protein
MTPISDLESTMNVKLQVRISEISGLPFTCVPSFAMWELVEFLAAHRTPVLYGYSPQGFTVTFQRLDPHAAQDLLNLWSHPQPPDDQQSARYNDALCYLPG